MMYGDVILEGDGFSLEDNFEDLLDEVAVRNGRIIKQCSFVQIQIILFFGDWAIWLQITSFPHDNKLLRRVGVLWAVDLHTIKNNYN